jgi:O-methyltransferase
MTVTETEQPKPLPPRLDTPFYRALRALRLFEPLRAFSRRRYLKRMQRCALKGNGLVAEKELTDCLVSSIERLRELNQGEYIGDYMEFGVCFGSSMACMHDALVRTNETVVRQFGFDSFCGLPPEADFQDEGLWSSGQLASSIEFATKLLNKRGIDWKRTYLIRGWFHQTLNKKLIQTFRIGKVGIIMIDSDIYSSAKEALTFIRPLIDRHAVILFDDWNVADLAQKNLGEKKAFNEFLKANPDILAAELPAYSEHAKVFLLTRTPPPG